MPQPEAIFVVGVARSGTTLMRNILERSDQIAIASETFLLGHLFRRPGALQRIRSMGDLRSDAVIGQIADRIYGSDFGNRRGWPNDANFWRWLIENVSREEMEQRLLASDRTDRGLTVAFLRAYADKQGRPIMGEKTPAHLAHVDELLDWFPNARIVHMVRDPRAVYVSDIRHKRGNPRRVYGRLMKLPGVFEAALLIHVTVVWRSAARRHTAYKSRYPGRYIAIRFEDVVREPAQALPPLFAFLGVAMPDNVDDVLVAARGFNAGARGLDADAADRWREQIGSFARRWLSFSCGGAMRKFGYR